MKTQLFMDIYGMSPMILYSFILKHIYIYIYTIYIDTPMIWRFPKLGIPLYKSSMSFLDFPCNKQSSYLVPWGWHFSGQRSWNSAKKNRSMAIQNLRENWTLLVKNLEFWLVVFRHPSEKWWSSSVGSILPNIWKNKIHVWNHQPAGVWWVFFKKIYNPTCYKPATPSWPRHPTPVPRVVNATSVWLFFASCLGEKIMASLVNLCYQHVSTIR